MGGITLVDTPTPSECHATSLKTISRAEALNQLALDASALVSQSAQGQQHASTAAGSFSISDFLVPGLQSKAWEDWQVADELNPFASGVSPQDFTSDLAALPFHFGLDGMLGNAMWDNTIGAANVATGLPADQAYDEFVFDLAPSNFATPATVNIADLLVGPNSAAPSVSPLDLAASAMPANFNNYEDLALANLYGFTEHESDVSDSDLGSDLSDADDGDSSSDEEDEDDEGEDENDQSQPAISAQDVAEANRLLDEDLSTAMAMSMATAAPVLVAQQKQQQQPIAEDPNKRRMEEALVARISNDLGPEHMAGLFKILKRAHDQEDADEDEDEEMEVDLSRLDEATLVELYQYVETCCMQTMGFILAAEEQERKRAAAAAKAREEEQLMVERERLLAQRTPELSPSHSSTSSSPSPPHPSSSSYNVSGCGSSNNKKRSATASISCTTYYERSGVEEQTEALWMSAQHKSKRKRVNNNSPACMGGGGTSKGRRKQKSMSEKQQHDDQFENFEEIGEDDEIDVVGI
ncbi:hypothetical protein EDD11_004774 [Mortierella claussenii]|nr:hypothetical protein EDD11_004774 [Mortierella claussenii]